MATATKELGREIETFRKEISKLQHDLSRLLEASGSYGKGKLLESKEKFQAAISSIKDQVREKAAHVYESCKEQGRLAVGKSRQTIGKKPFTSVLVAFFAGALLARLSRRRQKSLVQESRTV